MTREKETFTQRKQTVKVRAFEAGQSMADAEPAHLKAVAYELADSNGLIGYEEYDDEAFEEIKQRVLYGYQFEHDRQHSKYVR